MRDCEFPILVELAGRSFTCDFSQARNVDERMAWTLELSRAWAAGARMTCQCPGHGDRLLRFDAGGRLRREAGTGFEHVPACVFHFPSLALSGMASYGAEIQLGDVAGEWRLKVGPVVDCPLEGFQRAPEPPPQLFSLRALLDLLWLVAGLNGWSPRVQPGRTVREVHDQLQRAAQDIYLDRYPLADHLLLGTPGVKEQKQANRAKASKALEKHHPFLALVPLAAWSEAREQAADEMLPLTDFDGIPAFDCPALRWERALCEDPFVCEAWRSGERILAMILATHQSARLARVEKLVLKPISSAWVPLASAKDRWMEHKLREEERRFWRPLSFDGRASRQLPDFWLEEGGKHLIPLLMQR